MSRTPNAPFTADSIKHLPFDNVSTRIVETALRAVIGQPVSDEDNAFVAAHLGTVSATWLKFKQNRVAFESIAMFAAMSAATGTPVDTGTLNAAPADESNDETPADIAPVADTELPAAA